MYSSVFLCKHCLWNQRFESWFYRFSTRPKRLNLKRVISTFNELHLDFFNLFTIEIIFNKRLPRQILQNNNDEIQTIQFMGILFQKRTFFRNTIQYNKVHHKWLITWRLKTHQISTRCVQLFKTFIWTYFDVPKGNYCFSTNRDVRTIHEVFLISTA